jgi:Transglutaminase-like superfamily
MTAIRGVLDFYTQPVWMTDPGDRARLLAALPAEPAALSQRIQGLLLHEHWAPAYGQTLSAERRSESQIRPVAEMLERLASVEPRPVEQRLVGICRHFSVLATAAFRAHGIPARARCGFGAYFNAGKFEDHWVVEYWRAAEQRWVMVDTQIDALQANVLKPDFDLLDVPRDRFVIAGDAWVECRAGRANPNAFGIFDMRGLWFIGGNLLRDFAALNNAEMLPWDTWGAMDRPDQPPSPEHLAFLDRIAELTRAPDTRFAELRALYDGDPGLRVPAKVFNVLTQRDEAVR